jgi:hypothetical protein
MDRTLIPNRTEDPALSPPLEVKGDTEESHCFMILTTAEGDLQAGFKKMEK